MTLPWTTLSFGLAISCFPIYYCPDPQRLRPSFCLVQLTTISWRLHMYQKLVCGSFEALGRTHIHLRCSQPLVVEDWFIIIAPSSLFSSHSHYRGRVPPTLWPLWRARVGRKVSETFLSRPRTHPTQMSAVQVNSY